MTDGNTYAINKHLDEREDCDALQEVTAELEQAEARIVELEAKLAEAERALDISCVIIEKLMEGEEDGNVPQPTQIRSYRVSDAEKLDAL